MTKCFANYRGKKHMTKKKQKTVRKIIDVNQVN